MGLNKDRLWVNKDKLWVSVSAGDLRPRPRPYQGFVCETQMNLSHSPVASVVYHSGAAQILQNLTF